MTNEDFIRLYRDKDVHSLALKKAPENIDMSWCLRQIEGYQLAKKKLPQWAIKEGIWFPPRLSIEQCSSESTANYKAEVAARLFSTRPQPPATFIDLTGGFGVDFSYMAPLFKKAIYVEQQAVLCDAARHNFPLLGLNNAEIINTQSTSDFLFTALNSVGDSSPFTLHSSENASISNHDSAGDSSLFTLHSSLIFLDPARRDDVGRKVFAIEDCMPDITAMQDILLRSASYVMVKLSPMLDITQALRSLHCVREVHVVSMKGECKELLFVMSKDAEAKPVTYHCINLETYDLPFVCNLDISTVSFADPHVGDYLLEPNASIMKAGVQDMLAKEYGLKKLHPMSNLYISPNYPKQEKCCETDDEHTVKGIAGRSFRITTIYDFSKQSLKQLRKEVQKANITIRNFPSTVAELRKQLKIKEGGDIYIFATTLNNGSHALLQCEKI